MRVPKKVQKTSIEPYTHCYDEFKMTSARQGYEGCTAPMLVRHYSTVTSKYSVLLHLAEAMSSVATTRPG